MRAGLLFALILVGCSQSKEASEPATLYRNSPIDPTMRLHIATFDAAGESGSFNLDNCDMFARFANANVVASSRAEGEQPYQRVGFWCEVGTFKQDGMTPTSFEREFPTDSRGHLAF